MTHPRALDDDTATQLERWYAEVEALGTVAAKCRELGISRATFYDTIARVRGHETKPMREKLSNWQMQELVDPISSNVVPLEPLQTVEEQNATPNND